MITAQQTIIMTTSERNVDAYHSQSTLTERYRDVTNVAHTFLDQSFDFWELSFRG